MTEKELRRLGRQDLLQLLLAQSKEVSRQRALIEELKHDITEEQELTERLKAKLDEKDETIAHLKRRLDAKDESMNKMKADTAEMSKTVQFLRSRLDEKDIALDAARARLDQMTGLATSSTRVSASTASADMKELDERLQRLKERIAQADTMAETLRKEEE